MLDMRTARILKNAIDKHFGKEMLSLNEASKMTAAPVIGKHGGYTVYSCQFGDLTIMVWAQSLETGMVVRAVKTQAW